MLKCLENHISPWRECVIKWLLFFLCSMFSFRFLITSHFLPSRRSAHTKRRGKITALWFIYFVYWALTRQYDDFHWACSCVCLTKTPICVGDIASGVGKEIKSGWEKKNRYKWHSRQNKIEGKKQTFPTWHGVDNMGNMSGIIKLGWWIWDKNN